MLGKLKKSRVLKVILILFAACLTVLIAYVVLIFSLFSNLPENHYDDEGVIIYEDTKPITSFLHSEDTYILWQKPKHNYFFDDDWHLNKPFYTEEFFVSIIDDNGAVGDTLGELVVGEYRNYPEMNYFHEQAQLGVLLYSGEKYCYVVESNTLESFSDACSLEAMRMRRDELEEEAWEEKYGEERRMNEEKEQKIQEAKQEEIRISAQKNKDFFSQLYKEFFEAEWETCEKKLFGDFQMSVPKSWIHVYRTGPTPHMIESACPGDNITFGYTGFRLFSHTPETLQKGFHTGRLEFKGVDIAFWSSSIKPAPGATLSSYESDFLEEELKNKSMNDHDFKKRSLGLETTNGVEYLLLEYQNNCKRRYLMYSETPCYYHDWVVHAVFWHENNFRIVGFTFNDVHSEGSEQRHAQRIDVVHEFLSRIVKSDE